MFCCSSSPTSLLSLPPIALSQLSQGSADFVFADFNITHGLTFAGASGTTACVNASELDYGRVHGAADEPRGSLDVEMREAGDELVTVDTRTTEVGEHADVSSNQVRRREVTTRNRE